MRLLSAACNGWHAFAGLFIQVSRALVRYFLRASSPKKSVQAALYFIGISVFVCACAWTESSDFRLSHCSVDDTEVSSTLVFRDEFGGTRTIVFMDRYREFALRWSTGKGSVWWENVLAVQIKPVHVGSDASILSVRYKYRNNPERVFEGGAIDRACLALLRSRYATQLKFEDI